MSGTSTVSFAMEAIHQQCRQLFAALKLTQPSWAGRNMPYYSKIIFVVCRIHRHDIPKSCLGGGAITDDDKAWFDAAFRRLGWAVTWTKPLYSWLPSHEPE